MRHWHKVTHYRIGETRGPVACLLQMPAMSTTQPRLGQVSSATAIHPERPALASHWLNSLALALEGALWSDRWVRWRYSHGRHVAGGGVVTIAYEVCPKLLPAVSASPKFVGGMLFRRLSDLPVAQAARRARSATRVSLEEPMIRRVWSGVQN